MKPKNIIFDLAGVFFEARFTAFTSYFEKLGTPNFVQYFSKTYYCPFFIDLDLGKILYDKVCPSFRKYFKVNYSDETIIKGFDLIVGPFYEDLIAWVKANKNSYNFYLLSNNNPLSYPYIMKLFYEKYNWDFNTLFIKSYYSQNLGLMKPAAEIFNYVVAENNLTISETLFVDDTLSNIEGAKALGFQVLYFQEIDDFWNLKL